jgi:aminocarboxymuconate-semialdehyde decarboxylase
VSVAIDELDRAVHVLGLKGAELDMVVNGENWDEPRFLPLFKAAEAMGAVLFFHPQPQHNLMMQFTNRYNLPNSIGVIVEDTLMVATLIFGGILDSCPNLKVCIAHGGGVACFGMGRLDHGWQVRTEARVHIQKPPSTYQRRLYYDCVVGSEPALRFLLDQVGADRVVLGSDWPFVRWDPSPVAWVKGLASLSQGEKDKILWRNLETLLNLYPRWPWVWSPPRAQGGEHHEDSVPGSGSDPRPDPARRSRARPGARRRPESDDVGGARHDRPDVVRSRRAHRHHHDHEGALRAP